MKRSICRVFCVTALAWGVFGNGIEYGQAPRRSSGRPAARRRAAQPSAESVRSEGRVVPSPDAGVGNVSVTATAGVVGPTIYATLKAAFDAINVGTHQGAVTITILADTTETATAGLSASGTGGAVYSSISIQPSGPRTISGSLPGAALINFDGADNVTVNGQNSGGNSLTIANNAFDNSPPISTIMFINGAQNDTITNCTILGSASTALGTGGGTIFFSNTTSVGNSNDTISHNNIGPGTTGNPMKAIESVGAGAANTGNVIDANNIYDFFSQGDHAGIDLSTGSSNWTISNNHIYQTTARVYSGAPTYSGIRINSAGSAHTITGNVIGYSAANQTGTTALTGGTTQFRGINLLAGNSTVATVIQNNVIAAIDHSTGFNGGFSGAAGFVGIEKAGSLLCSILGNTIGSLDGSATIAVHDPTATSSWLVIGIRGSTTGDTITGNSLGAISIDGSAANNIGFRGIDHQNAGGNGLSITNNTIGGALAAGGISNTMNGSFTNYEMYGILANNSDATITGNAVRSISSSQGGNTYGILAVANNATLSIVSRNLIYGLTGNNVYGMSPQLGAPPSGTNRIERNFIHSLRSNSANKQIFGMYLPGNANMIVANNMIRLGFDAAGNPITLSEDMEGIQDQNGGVREYYFNSIYLGGTVTNSSNDTFAFGGFNNGTRTFKDNIFWNARSNAAGGGHNYAIMTPTPAPASDFNDLFVTGTAGAVGRYNGADRLTLADWQAATLQDANSRSQNPLFTQPNGSAATVDLHISTGTPMVGAGTTIAGITIDFDNQARPTPPAIGADQPFASTAAGVSISGRVRASDGTGIRNATVTLTLIDGRAVSTVTNAFGQYVFDDVAAGQTVVLSAGSGRYHFATLVLNVTDRMDGIDIVAN